MTDSWPMFDNPVESAKCRFCYNVQLSYMGNRGVSANSRPLVVTGWCLHASGSERQNTRNPFLVGDI